MHLIIPVKLEPYRSLLSTADFCTAWHCMPEPLLLMSDTNLPKGQFGARASLFDELGIAAHESVIKISLKTDAEPVYWN